MANLNDTITDGTAKFKVVKSATSNDVSDHNNLATAHSNGISGNAATATKATGDKNGNDITTTYLKLTGGTLSNVLRIVSTGGYKLTLCKEGLTGKDTLPTTTQSHSIGFNTANVDASNSANCVGKLGASVFSSGLVRMWLKAYRYSLENPSDAEMGVDVPLDGEGYAYAPTYSVTTDNSDKIATTAWIRNATGDTGLNAATATKATGDKNGDDIANTYLKKTGGTLTGQLKSSAETAYKLVLADQNLADKSTLPSSWKNQTIGFTTAPGNASTASSSISTITSTVRDTGLTTLRLTAYRFDSANNDGVMLSLEMPKTGEGYVTVPTPANDDNSTKIATTAWVNNNAKHIFHSDQTRYVSNASGANGDGTTAANAMSITDAIRFLATCNMSSGTGNLNNSYRLTLCFVPTGTSYGNISFDHNKMPGIKYLTITTSTGIDSTNSNYTTNSPTFNNLTISGSGLEVTLKNINVALQFSARYGCRVNLNTHVCFAKLLANECAQVSIQNGIYGIHNNYYDYLFSTDEKGAIYLNVFTATLHFLEQCYYSQGIFKCGTQSTIYIYWSRIRQTGTKPIVVVNASGTLTGTSSTAAGTAAKTVTLASGQTFTLATDVEAIVTFDNTNTANNPTLNINSTGAKPIYYNGKAIPKEYLRSDTQYKFKYNGTQYECLNTFNRLWNFYNNCYVQTVGDNNIIYDGSTWCFSDTDWPNDIEHRYRGNNVTIDDNIYNRFVHGALIHRDDERYDAVPLHVYKNYNRGQTTTTHDYVDWRISSEDDKHLGHIRFNLFPNSTSHSWSITAMPNIPDTSVLTEPYACLNVNADADGNHSITTNTKPLISDNSDKIPTTYWVRHSLGAGRCGPEHNAHYRGNNITSLFDDGTLSTDINDAVFDNVFVGDYIVKTINLPAITYTNKSGTSVTQTAQTFSNVKWLVAGCDLFYGSGPTSNQLWNHHIVLIADRPLQLNVGMNPTNDTTGGYINSDMFKIHMPNWTTAVKNAFGAAHVLSHHFAMSNATSSGTSSNYAVTEATVNIPNECMIYGTSCYGNAYDNGYMYQFPIFALQNHLAYSRACAWTSTVASTQHFVITASGESAGTFLAGAKDDYCGIRPYFLLK